MYKKRCVTTSNANAAVTHPRKYKGFYIPTRKYRLPYSNNFSSTVYSLYQLKTQQYSIITEAFT